MTETLSQPQLDLLSALLSGPDGADFIHWMKAVSMGELAAAPAPETERAARTLTLVESTEAPWRLTPLGWKVSDSMREYELWIERDRTLHRERRVQALDRGNFAGQRVLEIGSGFGSNLLTLQTVAREAVGLEMEPIAVQLAPLLARHEGAPAPRIVQGVAERMPFEDASFDTVMAFGSLQYMSIPLALREAARVLRPGGRLLAILSSWRQFVGCSGERLRRTWRPGPVIDTLCAGVNMLFYQHARATGPVLKRRSIMNNYVYPTHGGMRRLLRRAGLRPADGPFTTIDHETVYEAYRE